MVCFSIHTCIYGEKEWYTEIRTESAVVQLQGAWSLCKMLMGAAKYSLFLVQRGLNEGIATSRADSPHRFCIEREA